MTFREVRHASAGARVAIVAIGMIAAASTLLSQWASTTSNAERTLLVALMALVVGLCLLVARVGVIRAGGLGLRYLGGGHVAVLVRPGPGVVLRTRGGERTYVVGSDRATELLDVLTTYH